MEAAYWQKAWSDNRIGFHQKNVNKWLMDNWSAMELPEGSGVFVPLCGKTSDMLWLHEQGHSVLGVELSDRAAIQFFTENELEYAVREVPDFQIFAGQNAASGLEIWVGDFFKLPAAALEGCSAYFDRAAMVALPDALRAEYARHMAHLMPKSSRGLLITFSFSVPDENVRKLLGPAFDICELEHYSGTERLGNLKERGLETLDERVYLLKRT